MENMARREIRYLGPEFDAFLYAAICMEKNGMLLTVVSALVG